MAAPIPRIEALSTRNFSVAYSAVPGAAHLFFYAGSGSPTVIHSATVVASDTRNFNAFWTAGDSAGMLVQYAWVASFASGYTYHRGYCHIIKTEG